MNVMNQKTVPVDPLIFSLLSGVFVLIALLNLFVGFSLPFFVLLTLIALPFMIKRPVLAALASLLVMIVFERWFSLVPIVIQDVALKIYPIDVFLFGSLLIAALQLPRATFQRIPAKYLRMFILYELFIVIVAGVSLLQGGDVSLVLSGLKNFAVYPLIAPLVAVAFASKQSLEKLWSTLLYGGLFVFVFFLIALALGGGVWTEFTPLSTTGERMFSIPHTLYALIAVVLLISGYVTSAFPKHWASWTPSVALMLLIPVAFSLQRHLWLGFGVAAIVLLAVTTFQQKLRLTRLYALIVVLIATLGILYGVVSTGGATMSQNLYALQQRSVSLLSLSHYRDVSAEWRALSWEGAVNAWAQSPVLGVGFGEVVRFEFEGQEQSIYVRDLHNDPLAVLTQFGAVGFVLWVAAFAVCLPRALTVQQDATKEWIRVSALAIMGMILAASVFSSYFQANILIIPFWITLGALWSVTNAYD